MKKYILFGVFLMFAKLMSAQTLSNYINEAINKHPEIKAKEIEQATLQEKINEVNTLPNTELGFGYLIHGPETKTGNQKFKISAKQMFPWFGTISAKEKYASAKADVQYKDVVLAKRKLTVSVSDVYYDLYTIKAKERVVKEQIALIKIYKTMATTAVEADKTSVVSVLRLDIRLNELIEKQQLLEQDFLATKTRFNKLLNRKGNESIQVVDSVFIPEKDEAFENEKLSLHPELLKYDKLYESILESEKVNQKEGAPSFGLGIDYINVNQVPNSTIQNNGKDVFMPTLSLSIPIFNNKYKSISKQNELIEQEIKLKKIDRRNTLETILDTAVKARNNSRIVFNTQKKNIEQTQNASQILLKKYETDSVNFEDLLDIEELELSFKLKQVDAVNTYYKESLTIYYLTK